MILTTKNEKPNEKIINSIINDTEKKSLRTECLNTGKVWKRNCPNCSKEIFYCSKYTLKKFTNKNTLCITCSNKLIKRKPRGKTTTEEDLKRICPVCNKEVKYTTKWSRDDAVRKNKVCKECKPKIYRPDKGQIEKQRAKVLNWKPNEEQLKRMSSFQKGRKHTKEQHNKIAESNRGKKRNGESKKRMRLSRIEYIKLCKGQFYPTYNINACKYFEELDKEMCWNGEYATKNGEYYIKELGYWTDYFEPKENIIIEYDESHHYDADGMLKEKDVKRMNEIKKYLHCKFFRYNEKLKELKEY